MSEVLSLIGLIVGAVVVLGILIGLAEAYVLTMLEIDDD